ncbi:MAG: hypothetical protein AAFO04_14170 [Cyanobacteria bacterium J06592_8]
MKRVIGNIPVVGKVARSLYHKWFKPSKPFTNSQDYWVERYDSGGDSGDGSYRELAKFKAEIINSFVEQNNVKTVIEYGCGDGSQLKLAQYPFYKGFDVSAKAVSMCKKTFLNDSTKAFMLMDDYDSETAELTLSLDVIYHLVEDNIFTSYMDRLFDSSEHFVIIYSSNTDENLEGQSSHVKHRNFTKWVSDMKPRWHLMKHIPNKYPYQGDTRTGSFADFFIYEEVAS